MDYRDRSNYDDMGSLNNRGGGIDKKGRRIIISVVLLGVALCCAILIIWFTKFRTPPVEISSIPQEVEVEVAQEELPPPVEKESALIATPEPTRTSLSPSRVTSRSITYTEHEVGESESLDSISSLYNISKDTILSVNAIKNLSLIRPPLVLRIPDRNGQLYTVQSGDTLSEIASKFNPTLGWKTLQELNNLSDAVIFPGQKIFIPTLQVEQSGTQVSFIRPSDGQITGQFKQPIMYGSSGKLEVLQGVIIENREQTNVVASSGGFVADIFNDVENKGLFVTLSHENGYRSTYAHLSEVFVTVSDTVKQGDLIGKMGSSGNIGKVGLYFSIEQDGVPFNPEDFF